MLQNQVLPKGRRWLYRVAILSVGTLLLLCIAGLLPQRLTAVRQASLAQSTPGTLAVIGTQGATPSTAVADHPATASPAMAVAEPTLAATSSQIQVIITQAMTLSPTASPAQTLAGSAQSEVVAVVSQDGATLVATPGGQAQQTLPVGAPLTVMARSADSLWLSVMTGDGATGWMATSNIIVAGVPDLPVTDGAAAIASAPNLTVTAALTAPVNLVTAIVATAAPQPSPAGTRTMLADRRPTVQVLNTVSRLNVRAGPSTTYPVITTAAAKAVFMAQARNVAGTWVQIELPKTPAGFGWVSTGFIKLSESVANLPISDQTSSQPLPTPVPSAPTNLATNPVVATSQPIVQPTAQPTAPPTAQPAARGGQPTNLSGKLVIQSQWGGTFYAYNLATGAVRALTSGMDPAISPNGTQIAFTRAGGANGVYLINADGSNEHRIFGERSGLRSPKWSPDGKWIAFSRADGEYQCRDLGNAGLCPSDTQLTADIPSNVPPAERKKIASQILSQFDQVSKANWMISRISATGADYRDLPALNSALAPDWTNAGIVYQSSGGLQKTADQPNGQTQRVYFDYNVADPDWQPGGGRIVFQIKQGPHWEIFAVNPDGSGVVGLTRPRTTLVKQLPSNVAPAWSPDGQHIVFLSNREPNDEAGQWRVWVMNADGSNQHPLPIDLPINYSYSMEQMVDWGL